MIDGDSKILMSEELVGMVPDLEENSIKSFIDSIVVVNLAIDSQIGTSVISGTLIGVLVETKEHSLKLDFKTELKTAYEFVKSITTTSGLSCRFVYMHLGDDEIHFEGPYEIFNPKIVDIDRQMKTCTLGIDLIKSCQ